MSCSCVVRRCRATSCVIPLRRVSLQGYIMCRCRATLCVVTAASCVMWLRRVSLQGYVVCPSERRFLLLFTFLKKNRKKKVMVFFNACLSVKFHHELLNYIDLPVMCIHVSTRLYTTLYTTLYAGVHCCTQEYTGVHGSTLHCTCEYTAVQESTLLYTGVHCGIGEHMAVHGSTLLYMWVHCTMYIVHMSTLLYTCVSISYACEYIVHDYTMCEYIRCEYPVHVSKL